MKIKCVTPFNGPIYKDFSINDGCIFGYTWYKKEKFLIGSENEEVIEGQSDEQECLEECTQRDWCKSVDWVEFTPNKCNLSGARYDDAAVNFYDY